MAIPSFDKLSKILKLEIEGGFRDKAVIGGLGKFADFWEKEAVRDAPAEQVTQIVALLRSYGTLPDRPARVQAIERIKTWMSSPASGPTVEVQPAPPPPPVEQPAPQVISEPAAPPPVPPSGGHAPDPPSRHSRPNRSSRLRRARALCRALPPSSRAPRPRWSGWDWMRPSP